MDLVANLKVDVRGPNGSPVPVQAGEVVVFYFSAHWCPPCKQFTPILAKVHALSSDSARNEARYTPTPPQRLHVIFVSGDKSEKEMKAYMAESHGRWSFVTFNSAGVQALNSHFGVKGIPSVHVCSPSGTSVVADARAEVMQCAATPSSVTALVQKWRAAASVRPDVLPCGAHVQLCGLKQEDLNGQVCKVTGADLISDRVRVSTSTGKIIAVRRDVCSQSAFGSVKGGAAIELFAREGGYLTRDGVELDAADVVLVPGTVVCLRGLQAHPEKNGMWGTVRSYDSAAGRFEVEVSPKETIRLKPVNLSIGVAIPTGAVGFPPPSSTSAADSSEGDARDNTATPSTSGGIWSWWSCCNRRKQA